MSQGFYEQEEGTDKLVCPECGHPVLISEYGETGLCVRCFEEHPITVCPCEYPMIVKENKE